jgi:hypothetical protein
MVGEYIIVSTGWASTTFVTGGANLAIIDWSDVGTPSVFIYPTESNYKFFGAPGEGAITVNDSFYMPFTQTCQTAGGATYLAPNIVAIDLG